MNKRLIVKARDKDLGNILNIYEFELDNQVCYEIELKTNDGDSNIILDESKAALLFSGLGVVFEKEDDDFENCDFEDYNLEDYPNKPTLKKDFWENLRQNDLKFFGEDD